MFTGQSPDSVGIGSIIVAHGAFAVARYSRCNFELDRIVSDIKLQFYHLPVQSAIFAWPSDPRAAQSRLQGDLDSWWTQVSRKPYVDRVESHQRQIWQLKLKIRYHTTRLLLFQPSQVIQSPPESSLGICFQSACSIIDSYEALHEGHALNHGWQTVQNIFGAGATLVYTFWTSKSVQASSSPSDLSRVLRTCSTLLGIGGEWWPSAKKASVGFGSVMDLTMRKAYTDAVHFKQPRLLPVRGPVASGPPDRSRRYQTEGFDTADVDQPTNLDSANPFGWVGEATSGQQTDSIVSDWSMDADTSLGDLPDCAPEIEDFFGQFTRAEFSWAISSSDGQQDEVSPLYDMRF